MNSATFLLAFNFSIGVAFAVAFLALTRGSGVRLGRWCAVGFVSAAITVLVEAFAARMPSVRLTSMLSFGSLMLALSAISFGLARHYALRVPAAWFIGMWSVATAFNVLVVFDLRRGTWGQALGYQSPFAIVLALSAGLVLAASPRRPIDLLLATILSLSAIQFLAKAVLLALSGHAPGVRDYVVSSYAFYSQTAGGILSLLLGLSLVGLVVTDVMEDVKSRLQRDPLSGLLNRAGFMERVAALSRRGTAGSTTVILADLDHFKSINDRFGHAAGDEVIRVFGTQLVTHFGDGATCGRIGGEEFCVLLANGASMIVVREHLEAVRSLMRHTRFTLLPAGEIVTASFGVAETDRDEPFDDVLRRADVALYAAKKAGRNRYHFALPRKPAASGGQPDRELTSLHRV